MGADAQHPPPKYIETYFLPLPRIPRIQHGQPLEQQVGVILHVPLAAGQDVRRKAAGCDHGQRRAKPRPPPGRPALPASRPCRTPPRRLSTRRCSCRSAGPGASGAIGGSWAVRALIAPQTGQHAGYNEPAQEPPLRVDDVVGCRGAQIHRHAGAGNSRLPRPPHRQCGPAPAAPGASIAKVSPVSIAWPTRSGSWPVSR